MKNAREAAAATGVMLAFASIAGATATEHGKEFSIDTHDKRSVQIEHAAQRIIELANSSPTRFTGKPPYSIGFTIATREGGTISYSVQTSTPALDPWNVEAVEVQQTGPNQANFDMSLMARTDGTWNMYCDTDPFSANGRNLAEIGQKTIELNGQDVQAHPDEAVALLDDELHILNTLVGTAAAEDSTPASFDICAVNLG